MNIFAVICAHNEERFIKEVVSEVSKYIDKKNIIVVDDGSVDSTFSEIKDKGIIILRNQLKSGKGFSLMKGFNEARKRGAYAIITLDGDGQHPPEYIPEFIEALKSSNFDVVVGSRMSYLKNMPLERRFSNAVTSFLISKRIRQRILDSQSGYRIFKSSILEKLDLKLTGFDFESEFLIKAGLNNFKIGFISIPTIYGDEKSKINKLKDTLGFIKLYLKSYSRNF